MIVTSHHLQFYQSLQIGALGTFDEDQVEYKMFVFGGIHVGT